jgi:hypothetical protein
LERREERNKEEKRYKERDLRRNINRMRKKEKI